MCSGLKWRTRKGAVGTHGAGVSSLGLGLGRLVHRVMYRKGPPLLARAPGTWRPCPRYLFPHGRCLGSLCPSEHLLWTRDFCRHPSCPFSFPGGVTSLGRGRHTSQYTSELIACGEIKRIKRGGGGRGMDCYFRPSAWGSRPPLGERCTLIWWSPGLSISSRSTGTERRMDEVLEGQEGPRAASQ